MVEPLPTLKIPLSGTNAIGCSGQERFSRGSLQEAASRPPQLKNIAVALCPGLLAGIRDPPVSEPVAQADRQGGQIVVIGINIVVIFKGLIVECGLVNFISQTHSPLRSELEICA